MLMGEGGCASRRQRPVVQQALQLALAVQVPDSATASLIREPEITFDDLRKVDREAGNGGGCCPA